MLVAAGLFVRTLHNLKSLNVGIATDHLVTFGVQPTLAGYRPDQTRDLDQRVLQTLAALPGVRSVAGTTDPELADDQHVEQHHSGWLYSKRERGYECGITTREPRLLFDDGDATGGWPRIY